MDEIPKMAITAEQLLQHSQWAHSLARHLVGDAAEAEDIVQDAWVAALQGPPPKGALRPWLGGVIRNLALMGHRTAGRRRVRERSVAKPEALPATDELVGRAEAQRMLVDAVLALAEPYRSVVILRYFENHSSAEIARDRGIPAGTVRSQLHDGLAKLRVLLDSTCGGQRSAWCVTLLPLARVDLMVTATAATSGGISSQALQGLLLMNTTKAAAGLAAVALLMAAIYIVLPTQPADSSGSSLEVAELPSTPEGPVADLGEDSAKSASTIAPRQEMPSSSVAAVDVFNVRASSSYADVVSGVKLRIKVCAKKGKLKSPGADDHFSVKVTTDGIATTLSRPAEYNFEQPLDETANPRCVTIVLSPTVNLDATSQVTVGAYSRSGLTVTAP